MPYSVNGGARCANCPWHAIWMYPHSTTIYRICSKNWPVSSREAVTKQ